MLKGEAVAGADDRALVGSAAEVSARLGQLRDIGATDFNAAITPTGDGIYEETLALLEDELS